MPSKSTVLVVEDDRFISRAYQDGLSRAGFTVKLAFNGQEALTALATDKPSLILLDLVMPVMNGFEFLEKIKNNTDYNKIPVVVLSNLGQESDIKKARDLGAVDYLVKSDIAIHQVIAKVSEYTQQG